MRLATLVAGFLLLAGPVAYAASPVTIQDPTNVNRNMTVNADGSINITGSFSLSGFTPATTGTPISVTTGGVTGTLPAGTVVIASNVGATNNAYCKLGASATTSDQLISPNSWFAFTVGASTQLTCITSTSTTTVNMIGGSGLATGAGGGGGGGGGGVVTQPTAANLNATVVGTGTFAAQLTGATNNINNIAGTVSLPTGAATAANQATANSSLATIATNSGNPVPACAASPCVTVIGLVTNDPCGQGTKLGAPISLTASGQIITGTSAKKTYVCSIDLVSATAQNIALVEGTGTVCATNIFGLAGGTTAATGWNLAANGGLTKGSGLGTVYIGSGDANAAAANVCLLLSSTGQTSGEITYVQQ